MPTPTDEVAQLLEGAGVGWYLGSDREQRLAQVLDALRAVEACYARKLSQPVARPLLEQLRKEPASFKPFIQTFAAGMTSEMRTMVYCILSGASVERVRFDYEAERQATLSVELELPTGERPTFESSEIWDLEVLRHFGTAKKGGRPLIDGYFAFRA